VVKLAGKQSAPVGKVECTNWQSRVHQLAKQSAPVGKAECTDWQSRLHRLAKQSAPVGKVGNEVNIINTKNMIFFTQQVLNY
jgi:hypothetical protein